MQLPCLFPTKRDPTPNHQSRSLSNRFRITEREDSIWGSTFECEGKMKPKVMSPEQDCRASSCPALATLQSLFFIAMNANSAPMSTTPPNTDTRMIWPPIYHLPQRTHLAVHIVTGRFAHYAGPVRNTHDARLFQEGPPPTLFDSFDPTVPSPRKGIADRGYYSTNPNSKLFQCLLAVKKKSGKS